ncbi:Holliday junction branch migration protein RuvA [Levilinea saccharolytica]|uniref:Holliday junction branch migration complex subunit RuvA n=1 Tax=Levilinea saccharolytica TaxID=229921 RepID=A0A0P6Y606_9CHLR|nr:Holliday junction branch migration protein RuvA [Levilinea saccharolytica]KPL91790.1 hypothetical protein ADN01_00460 [Levilinea saccharolytica]GAP17601.1 Holliday junction DNA helicase subunit RuvA [Levilinea saccharolytica]
MIASVSGDVQAVLEDSLIVGVGGVGLRVFVTAAVRAQVHVGDGVFLFTTLIVREDLLALYGFETQEEERFFNLLLGADGVGPKLALAVLSTLNVEAIRRAVLAEQADIFSRVSGVGKKTAQKILLHLQGKVGAGSGLEVMALGDADGDVLDALTALGYSVVEAQTAIQAIPRDAPPDMETRLRLALQYFSR